MFLKPQGTQLLKIEKSWGLYRFFRLFLSKQKTEVVKGVDDDENRELLESIKNAQTEWIAANMNFEFAREDRLVDYYTYKIKACEVRYDYLLRKAKEKGVRVEGVERYGG